MSEERKVPVSEAELREWKSAVQRMWEATSPGGYEMTLAEWLIRRFNVYLPKEEEAAGGDVKPMDGKEEG